MKESDIEKKLVAHIKKMGGIAYKFSSPAHRSVPDRLVLLPDGLIYFVECKAPGRRPTKAQDREMDRIRALGFNVLTIDDPELIKYAFTW